MKKFLVLFLIFLETIIITGIYYVKHILKNVYFYQITYSLFNKSGGSGSETVVKDAILECLPFLTVVLIVLCIPLLFPSIKNYLLIYSISICVIPLIILLHNLEFDKFIYYDLKNTDIYEKEYVESNDVQVTFNNKKNNLILIYLESMESSLFSKKNGGAFEESIIPELEQLAKNNLSFSNTNTLGGGKTLEKASFTMASFVASTSGVPVNTKLFQGYTRKPFMLNVRTMFDILKEEGYNLEILQGSEIEFASTDKYVNLHGNMDIFDYNKAIEKKYIDKDYFEWWGIEDKKLFEFSKKEINNLSKKDKPFAAVLFTMDTHFRDGYLDSSCDEKFDSHLSNSYYCSSKIVSEFIEYLKGQDYYKDTTIVLIGDHITMQNDYYKGIDNYDRRTYNVFINSVVETDNNKNREFTSLDLYPTILSSMGANIKGDRLGLGVNLFSNEKTLLEKYGYDYLNNELKKNSKYFNEKLK